MDITTMRELATVFRKALWNGMVGLASMVGDTATGAPVDTA